MNACDLVDRHFAAALTPAGEARLRSHLPGCAACTRHYRRHLMLEKLDPAARGPKQRLRRAIGLGAPRRPWLWLGAPALAVAAGLLLLAGDPARFVARGGHGPDALEIHRAAGGRVESSLRTTDELAFAYRNPAKKPRLMIFAVDEHRHVFWYHPGWVNASDEPTAVAIATDAALHELPEAIAQPLDGGDLRIIAWFLDEPLSVKRAEALSREGKAPPGAVVVQRQLRVER